MQKLLKSIDEAIPGCLVKDQFRFRRRNRRLRDQHRKGMDIEEACLKLSESVERSSAVRERREASIPRLNYPDLPVSGKREEIAKAIRENQVLIVCGETGSGKTTQLPKICLSIGRGCAGLIGHTQPRRLAASTVARRIAEELNQPLGQLVGYKIRFQDHVQPQTLVKLMTDGILLAEIQNDPFLNAYDTLILDEAHERSLNIDFLLGYLKWLLPRRSDLKLIITSATIDPERFSVHFDEAPVIEVSGRGYPVEIRYRPITDQDSEENDADIPRALLSAIRELGPDCGGDILAFMSGEREIRETADYLRKTLRDEWDILPLFSRLSAKEQGKVFQSDGKRRIVVSTNVAETSLTVPRIHYVIDSGLARLNRYSVRSKIQRLPIEKISQSSANQRAGRCGRLGPGICIRLYSEEDFESRPEHTDAEILRTNLAAVILQMKSLKLGDIDDFPFIEAPDPRMIRDGLKLLQELNAIDGQKKLTPIGRDMARIPIDPRLSRMLIAAKQLDCIDEVAIIAAALSIQDPRERPIDRAQAADEKQRIFLDKDSDFLSFIHLWRAMLENQRDLSNSKFRSWCRDHFLSYRRLREWKDIYRQLMQILRQDFRIAINENTADYESIHKALLTGLLSNIGFRKEQSEYLGARNIKFYIHPGSGLFKSRPNWLVAAEQVETGQVYGRSVARIDPQWIEQIGAHLVQLSHFEPHWQKRPARVAVYEKSTLFGLTLQNRRTVPYEKINPQDAREIFIRSALVEQQFVCNAGFFNHNRALLEELGYLQHKGRRLDLIADEEILFRFFDERIPASVVDGNSFNRWRRKAERTRPDLLKLQRQEISGKNEHLIGDEQFPDHIDSGTLSVKLEYRFEPGHPEDGVTAIIPLVQLNQVEAEVFEWLVPGFRKEKIVSLIKGLPKSMRRNFVPAPDYAERFLTCPGTVPSLYRSLAEFLSGLKPLTIRPQDLRDCTLSEHLLINFKVIDQDGKTVATSRNLNQLKQRFGDHSKQVFTDLADRQIVKSGCTGWDFGTLLDDREIGLEAGVITAFPALIDEGESVGLRFFDQQERADRAHEFGLTRLIQLHLKRPVKQVRKLLCAESGNALLYAKLAKNPAVDDHDSNSLGEFDNDLLHRIVATVFLQDQTRIRNKAEFESCLTQHQHQLFECAENMAGLVTGILDLTSAISRKLNQLKIHPTIADDLNQQMSLLVYRGFIANTPFESLKSFPRYLKGIAHRIDKAVSDESRDLRRTQELEPLWSAYWTWIKNNPDPIVPEQDDYRWRLEEFRISLFAQMLKTAYPVSRKRLEKIWAERC